MIFFKCMRVCVCARYHCSLDSNQFHEPIHIHRPTETERNFNVKSKHSELKVKNIYCWRTSCRNKKKKVHHKHCSNIIIHLRGIVTRLRFIRDPINLRACVSAEPLAKVLLHGLSGGPAAVVHRGDDPVRAQPLHKTLQLRKAAVLAVRNPWR